jgi:hypothetical protein
LVSETVDRNGRARRRQELGDTPPDAAGSAGHDGNAAVEPEDIEDGHRAGHQVMARL